MHREIILHTYPSATDLQDPAAGGRWVQEHVTPDSLVLYHAVVPIHPRSRQAFSEAFKTQAADLAAGIAEAEPPRPSRTVVSRPARIDMSDQFGQYLELPL